TRLNPQDRKTCLAIVGDGRKRSQRGFANVWDYFSRDRTQLLHRLVSRRSTRAKRKLAAKARENRESEENAWTRTPETRTLEPHGTRQSRVNSSSFASIRG